MEGINIVFSEATKAIVIRFMKETITRANIAEKIISQDFKIEGEEFSIKCPERIQTHSISFRITKSLLSKHSKKFDGPVRRVTLKSLAPLRDLTRQAIQYTDDGGFRIIYDPLKSGEIYLMEIEYDIDPNLISSLVKKNSALESSNERTKEYWMHAELKHLDIFKEKYKNVEIKDLDFFVDVAVHEDIATSIPPAFKRELETIIKWIQTNSREEKIKLSHVHLKQKRSMELPKNFNFIEAIKNLQEVFLDRNFRTFVEVERDFYYYESRRGVDLYNLPFPTWPRTVTVISRTTLDYEHPASEGELKYKHYLLKKKVEEIFNNKE